MFTTRKSLVLALATATAIAMPMVGCSSSSSSSQDAGSSSEPAQTEPAQTEQATQTEQPAQADSEYAVTIDSAQVTTNYEDAPAVLVTYTFTNNSDSADSFLSSVSTEVYQDGVQLDTTFGSDYDSSSTMNKVKPGASTQVQMLYALTSDSDIEVVVTPLFSFDDTVIAQKTFSVA